MTDWIANVLHLLDTELGRPTVVAALLAGLLCSLAFTQVLKKLGPEFPSLSDRQLRGFIRFSAFVFGFVPTYLLWPGRGWPGVLFGFVIGVLAPAIYAVAVRIIVHYLPWIDPLVSARPKIDDTNRGSSDGGP